MSLVESHFFSAARFFLLAGLVCACDPEPLTVTSTSDGASGSLRDVIDEANDSDAASLRIEVPPGTYELTRCGADDDNAGGDLDITAAVPIALVGTGPGVVIKQTCAGERALEHHGVGRLTVSGITISGGNATEDGGAIRAQLLTLSNVTLSGNSGLNGGAIHVQSLTADELRATDNGALQRGGALYVTGDATLRRSTVGNNVAAVGGGVAVDGTLTMTDTRITANRTNGETSHPSATSFYTKASIGAGILAHSVEGDRVTIDNNHLHSCTGWSIRLGVRIESMGGGIFASTISLTNATVTNNTSPPCALVNGAPTFFVGPPTGVGLHGKTVTLDHTTIADNMHDGAVGTDSLTSQRSLIVGAPDGLLGPLADNGGLVLTRLPHLGSAAVDQIPETECPVRVDARGVSRPQGDGCDLGAVEAVRPAGLGADLSVAFVNPPVSLVAGRSATWQIAVENKGPGAQMPAVFIDDPDVIGVTSVTVSGGATCAGRRPIVCAFPLLPPGARETITVVGELAANWGFMHWRARLSARGVVAPLDDDQAELWTPVTADAALRMEARAIGEEVSVSVFNTGPYSALGPEDDPVRIAFRPAPGVHVSPAEWNMVGLFPMSTEAPAFSRSFTLSFDGAPPTQLGTVELDPSINTVTGATSIPVFYVPRSDLRVALWREPGVIPVGASIPVTVEVANVGPGAATDALITLALTPNVTWTADAGSVEPTATGHDWRIPSLAAGRTVLLRGSVTAPAEPSFLSVESIVFGDAVYANNRMSLDVTASPNGTSDLRLSMLDMTGNGPYAVRATLTNAGPAAHQAAAVSVYAVDASGAMTPMTGANVVESSLPWDCDRAICRTWTSLASGSSHTLEFILNVYEPMPFNVFSVTVHSNGSSAPDPDPRNNSGEIWR